MEGIEEWEGKEKGDGESQRGNKNKEEWLLPVERQTCLQCAESRWICVEGGAADGQTDRRADRPMDRGRRKGMREKVAMEDIELCDHTSGGVNTGIR